MDIRYRAIDAAGKTVSGTLAAADEAEAVDLLRQRQLVPIEITAVRVRVPTHVRRGSQRISLAQKALAVREIATLLSAGVGLVETIENLAHAHRADPVGKASEEIKEILLGGGTFTHAIQSVKLQLPDYVFVLARTGEMTGKLAASLHDAADQMEYDERVRQDARNALVYPAILMTTGIGAVLLIFTVVVPRFTNLLNNPKADLPTISVWVLQSGLFFRSHIGLIGAALALGGILLASALRSQDARIRLLNACARMPVLGAWIESTTVARWSSILAVLVDNRVPIIDALDQARASSPLHGFGHRLDLAQKDVRAGKRLAEALELHRVIDATGVSMVRVGERSGDLGPMLRNVANYWTRINQNRMKRLLAMIEPVTILVIGAAIGIIMAGVMLAIASLSNLTL